MAINAFWLPYNLREGSQGRRSEWGLQKQAVMSVMTTITWWVLLTKQDQKSRKQLQIHTPDVCRRKATLPYLSF